MPTVKAGDILKEVVSVMGGSCGGRPEFAQGSAPDRGQLHKAFEQLLLLQ
ncbi:MAG: DHHA1 domain-containing protein [Bdellovibrionales bacterium]